LSAQIGRGATIWLTGLPGAGKTTLALALRAALTADGHPVCILDGDELRQGLSGDLGFSPADRGEQARRAAHVAVLLSRSDVLAIVALVSPFAHDRRAARRIHAERGLPFLEVWVDTPLSICERRDPSGLYTRARSGALAELTGMGAPYEPPLEAELRVSGCEETPQGAASRVIRALSLRLAPELVR
jgi:bifunctional enzyme CysN/CysC